MSDKRDKTGMAGDSSKVDPNRTIVDDRERGGVIRAGGKSEGIMSEITEGGEINLSTFVGCKTLEEVLEQISRTTILLDGKTSGVIKRKVEGVIALLKLDKGIFEAFAVLLGEIPEDQHLRQTLVEILRGKIKKPSFEGVQSLEDIIIVLKDLDNQNKILDSFYKADDAVVDLDSFNVRAIPGLLNDLEIHKEILALRGAVPYSIFSNAFGLREAVIRGSSQTVEDYIKPVREAASIEEAVQIFGTIQGRIKNFFGHNVNITKDSSFYKSSTSELPTRRLTIRIATYQGQSREAIFEIMHMGVQGINSYFLLPVEGDAMAKEIMLLNQQSSLVS